MGGNLADFLPDSRILPSLIEGTLQMAISPENQEQCDYYD